MGVTNGDTLRSEPHCSSLVMSQEKGIRSTEPAGSLRDSHWGKWKSPEHHQRPYLITTHFHIPAPRLPTSSLSPPPPSPPSPPPSPSSLISLTVLPLQPYLPHHNHPSLSLLPALLRSGGGPRQVANPKVQHGSSDSNYRSLDSLLLVPWPHQVPPRPRSQTLRCVHWKPS